MLDEFLARVDRDLADRPGHWGVMLDDVVAGILAGAVMLLAAGVSHGWF